MEAERAIRTLAATQYALVTNAQLRAVGFTQRMIDRRVGAGTLDRLHRGVYRIGGSVDSFEQRTLAACLSIGGLVGASHRCAAHLWGEEVADPVPIEVVVQNRRHPFVAGAVVQRSLDLRPDHIVRLHGIPVTTPNRLLIDLGAVVDQRQVANTLDDLIGEKRLGLAAADVVLDELGKRGRDGTAALRAELERRDGDPLSRTRLEALMIDLSATAGLPQPTFQYEIVVGGRRRVLDFAFPEIRLAIEVDGYRSHSRYDVFEDDRVRGNDLLLAGWRVLHFTWYQLRYQPDLVLRVILAALAEAS